MTTIGVDDDLGNLSDPNSTALPPEMRGNRPVLHVLFAIVVTVVVIMIIFGNIINLMVLTRTKRLHTNPGFFMVSLAFADLGAGLVNLITSIPSSYLNYWPFPQAICDLAGFFAAWFYTVSIYTLTAVSVDRFMAIAYPLRYHELVPMRYCVTTIVVIWLLAPAIFLVPFMGYGSYEYKWTTYICMCDFTKYFWITMAADFLVILPCTALTAFCYIRIYIISRKHASEIRNQTFNQVNTKRGAKLKAIKTIAITVLAFYISWIPYSLQQNTLLFVKGVEAKPLLDFSLNWIAIGNSFMNCIIYSSTNRVYRESGRQMLAKFTCYFCGGKVDPERKSGAERPLDRHRDSRDLTISLG